jgi:HSP20 family protein
MAINDLVPWKWGEKRVPVRRELGDPFYALHREFDQMFDDFFGGGFIDRAGAFNPRVDVTENDHEINVTAELPGLDQNNIEISLSGDVLTLSGEKKAEKEDQGENYYRLERSFGSFRGSIPLPVGVEADKVEATFKSGVLHVTLPKLHPGQEAKKITVKSGS